MDEEIIPEPTSTLDALAVLMQYAEAEGDISSLLTDEAIARLTAEVCENYERDDASRDDWKDIASKALEDMAKCKYPQKDTPWTKASNVHYPLLPYAVMQFNARAYPAIVKGDEAVSVKVVGVDNGKQAVINGQPVFQIQGMPIAPTPQGPMLVTPQGLQPVPEGAKPEPMWERPPGAKSKRAGRVRDFMNATLFYRMEGWESETDTLLFQMPAIGLGFRKQWFDGKHRSRFVPALKLVVNNDAKSLEEAPQITEEIDGVYPFQIERDIAIGKYREITLDPEDKESRLLIEQQCYHDLDGDGLAEPYIVTVDHKSKQLLRVVPDFGPESVKLVDNKLAYIERRKFYVKYEFLPHPEGKFYNIGLAHLLDQYGEIVNTLVNQMIDANTAMVAGGGFVASGLRLQGRGQSSSLKFRPGEYKTVNGATGGQIRDGIVDRTLPNPSPLMFQLLELILGAAENIASIKDVLTGDASNTGQVGTTLAMIEQGLQVFTAIYKRVYRGLKAEFALLFENIGRYGDEQTAQEYMELLDDPEADFAKDFNNADMDIRPISDPTSVTKMQRLSRAQFLLGTMEQVAQVGGDAREILRRVYEAADIEDIEKILPEKQPGPMDEIALADAQAGVEEKKSKAIKNVADAQAKEADTALKTGKQQLEEAKTEIEAFQVGLNVAA